MENIVSEAQKIQSLGENHNNTQSTLDYTSVNYSQLSNTFDNSQIQSHESHAENQEQKSEENTNGAQKRHADYDENTQNSQENVDDNSQKRQRTESYNGSSNRNNNGYGKFNKLELRILLPSKDAGAIIGRGGSNIKKLRQDHKTIIQVPDCDGPERLLLIGGDAEASINTLLDVFPLLEESQKNPGSPIEFRFLVHQSQAGCVIGRGGDKIKDLRTKHNLDMKVYSDCAPNSTERCVQMRGKPDDIIGCLKETLELLDTAPPKGVSRPYDPHNYDEFNASNYGGYQSDRRGGSGGGGGKSQGGNFNKNKGAGNRDRDGNFGGFGGEGNFGGFGGGSFGSFGGFGGGDNDRKGGRNDRRDGGRNKNDRNDRGNRGNFNRNGNRGNQGNGGGGFGTNASNNNSNQNSQTNQVTIPNDFAGAIIGPKGSKIASIRQQSGADINIDRAIQGNNDRVITITGTPEQIQNAQYLLQLTVKQSGLWQGQSN